MPVPVRPKPKKVFLSPFETLLSLVCLQLSILFSSSLSFILLLVCRCHLEGALCHLQNKLSRNFNAVADISFVCLDPRSDVSGSAPCNFVG